MQLDECTGAVRRECGCIPAHVFTVFSSGFDIDQVQCFLKQNSAENDW